MIFIKFTSSARLFRCHK